MIVGAVGIVEGKKALELTQRAWVVPITANLMGSPEAGKAFHFLILFINSGREPALNVDAKFTTATIDAFDPQTIDMRDIKITAEDPVSVLIPLPGEFSHRLPLICCPGILPIPRGLLRRFIPMTK